jgi:hypothetical protein
MIQSRQSGVRLKKEENSLLSQFSIATWVPKRKMGSEDA